MILFKIRFFQSFSKIFNNKQAQNLPIFLILSLKSPKEAKNYIEENPDVMNSLNFKQKIVLFKNLQSKNTFSLTLSENIMIEKDWDLMTFLENIGKTQVNEVFPKDYIEKIKEKIQDFIHEIQVNTLEIEKLQKLLNALTNSDFKNFFNEKNVDKINKFLEIDVENKVFESLVDLLASGLLNKSIYIKSIMENNLFVEKIQAFTVNNTENYKKTLNIIRNYDLKSIFPHKFLLSLWYTEIKNLSTANFSNLIYLYPNLKPILTDIELKSIEKAIEKAKNSKDLIEILTFLIQINKKSLLVSYIESLNSDFLYELKPFEICKLLLSLEKIILDLDISQKIKKIAENFFEIIENNSFDLIKHKKLSLRPLRSYIRLISQEKANKPGFSRYFESNLMDILTKNSEKIDEKLLMDFKNRIFELGIGSRKLKKFLNDSLTSYSHEKINILLNEYLEKAVKFDKKNELKSKSYRNRIRK